jgi:hypothetical protein
MISCFQLSTEEWKNLKSQIVTSNKDEDDALRSQIVTLEKGRGKHRKYMPYVFTEQGVAMLSSVLNSTTAIQVNISIMRVFVKMRKWAANYEDLLQKISSGFFMGFFETERNATSRQMRTLYPSKYYPCLLSKSV